MADKELRISGPVLVSAACFVVVVAGVRAAQPIIVPFVVAAFLAMISLPPLQWLREKGLPTWAALLVMTVVIILVALLLIGVIGTSVNQLRHELPVYQERVEEIQAQLVAWLEKMGIVGDELQQESLNAQRALSLFGNMLGALGSVLSDALMIVFILIFLLLEAADLPDKLRAIAGGDDSITGRFETIQRSVRQYISIKTRLSFLTGVLVVVWLWACGVDFPLLWGLLAFLFNYIPNIGSFIAAVPAVVLAYLKLGPATAIYAALGYVVINVVIGNVIEPRVMGRGLGLSTLVVFLSLVFWGWVLGPIGMLFSVPLTMIVKIVLDHSEDMRWVGTLLSAGPARR